MHSTLTASSDSENQVSVVAIQSILLSTMQSTKLSDLLRSDWALQVQNFNSLLCEGGGGGVKQCFFLGIRYKVVRIEAGLTEFVYILVIYLFRSRTIIQKFSSSTNRWC